MQHLESSGSNFEVYSLEPVQVNQKCESSKFFEQQCGQGYSEQAEGKINLV